MKEFEIGQRVKINDKQYPNEFNGISGTVTGVDTFNDGDEWYCVGLDEIPKTRKFKGKMFMYFDSKVLEAIEDEPIEKEVEHIIEEQEAEEIKHAKLSNEEIALELVKAWAGQSGQPAKYKEVVKNYLDTLEALRNWEE